MRNAEVRNIAALLLCVIFDVHAAMTSRTILTFKAEAETDARWNPFKAMADAASRWTGIDKMRGDLCWDRENLLEHEECMEWMVSKCKSEDADPKRCDKLKKYVKKHCDAGEELGCKYAEQLGVSVEKTAIVAPAPAPMHAPAPVPAAPAPGPAPAEEQEETTPAPTEAPTTTPAEKEAPAEDTATTGKPPKLQSQGFEGKKVRHKDGKTMSSDWGDEYEHPTTTTVPERSGARSPTFCVVLPILSWAISSVFL